MFTSVRRKKLITFVPGYCTRRDFQTRFPKKWSPLCNFLISWFSFCFMPQNRSGFTCNTNHRGYGLIVFGSTNVNEIYRFLDCSHTQCNCLHYASHRSILFSVFVQLYQNSSRIRCYVQTHVLSMAVRKFHFRRRYARIFWLIITSVTRRCA